MDGGGSHLDEAGPGPLLTHRRSIFFHEFNHSYRHSFTSLFNEPTLAGCLLYARSCTLPWEYVSDQDACSLVKGARGTTQSSLLPAVTRGDIGVSSEDRKRKRCVRGCLPGDTEPGLEQ